MSEYQETIDDFLNQKRIAVAGVSRQPKETANFIYRTLRDIGYEVLAVNPNASEVEGDPCYPNLASIPGGVDAVLVVTHPEKTLDVVRECAELGVRRVWMHRSFGQGSVADEAVTLCRKEGIRVIPGGCPMMFREGADFGHKCMRFVLQLTGGLFQNGGLVEVDRASREHA